MVQQFFNHRKIDTQPSHSRGNAAADIVDHEWRYPRKSAIERELAVRPSVVSALASCAEDYAVAVNVAVALSPNNTIPEPTPMWPILARVDKPENNDPSTVESLHNWIG
jgi:hypothetical protein